jgi:hypothetical protein
MLLYNTHLPIELANAKTVNIFLLVKSQDIVKKTFVLNNVGPALTIERLIIVNVLIRSNVLSYQSRHTFAIPAPKNRHVMNVNVTIRQ